MATEVKNPFRDAMMRQNFEAAVQGYLTKHRNFFYPDGSPSQGNSFAMYFWKGYNNVNVGAGFNDADSRSRLAYAYWKAGEAMRHLEKGAPVMEAFEGSYDEWLTAVRKLYPTAERKDVQASRTRSPYAVKPMTQFSLNGRRVGVYYKDTRTAFILKEPEACTK